MADTNPDTNPDTYPDEDEDECLSSGNSDYDETTEEGLARSRRRDALIGRGLDRQIQERHAEARSKIPAAAFEIPASLYEKARDHNDQLTDAERALLHSRGDLVGRALADPDALTPDEAYRVMLWPAPDVVRARVRRVTGGRADGPAELFAEAKAGRILTVAECALLLGMFYAGEPPDWMMEEAFVPDAPGVFEAANLVFARRFHHPEGLRALVEPSLVGKDMDAVAMAALEPLDSP